MTRMCSRVLVLLLTCVGILAAQQGPSPELRSRISGFAGVFGGDPPASPEALDRFRLDAFAPALQAKISAEQNRAMAARLRAEFGAFSVAEVRRRDPDTVVLVIKGAKGRAGQIVLGLEPQPPHLITAIAVEAGGPEDAYKGPVPPIDGSMADAELAAALDGFFAPLAGAQQFSGTVLVARDGTPIFEKAYGLADRSAERPNTPATLFNLASINKAFTRAAVAQLMAQGKLALDDTIGSILPDYPNKDAHPATVDQLLEHRVGIADFFGAPFRSVDRTALASNAEYMRLVAPLPLAFPPGADTRYCNGCYIVLGEMIARVSGTTYEAYVQEHIFQKAGMRTAGFVGDDTPDVAMGYLRRDGTLQSNRPGRGARGSAAGGAYASAADLLAYDNALREGRLLDAKAAEWYFGGASPSAGRARAGIAIAGGSPGVNTALHSDGTWTVVILSNFDPPFAEQVGGVILRRLRRQP